MIIRAAIFNASGVPTVLANGNAKQLNANTNGGKVWRELPPDVLHIEDVPALGDLPVHPLFVARTD